MAKPNGDYLLTGFNGDNVDVVELWTYATQPPPPPPQPEPEPEPIPPPQPEPEPEPEPELYHLQSQSQSQNLSQKYHSQNLSQNQICVTFRQTAITEYTFDNLNIETTSLNENDPSNDNYSILNYTNFYKYEGRDEYRFMMKVYEGWPGSDLVTCNNIYIRVGSNK